MARTNTLAVSRKQVAAIIAATFPEYRGLTIYVNPSDMPRPLAAPVSAC